MITPDDELTALLTLSKIEGLGLGTGLKLYRQFGNALSIFKNSGELENTYLPGVNRSIKELLNDSGYLFAAQAEREFLEKHHIRAITLEDEDYPARLSEITDPPLVLFALGNADYNSSHALGIVGTRHATEYGRDLTNQLVKEVHDACPDALIISGMAYGIDIAAHRAAIECGATTIGVLAHGLDQIYPPSHKKDALRLLENGSLITEFMSGGFPEKFHFVQRNRIIAGLSDAVVVVESAQKGGSLITAEYAEMYSRDCYAYPGGVYDKYSQGCNNLIRDNRASLITCPGDLLEFMGWGESGKASQTSIMPQLFPNMTTIEKQVYDLLAENPGGVHTDRIGFIMGMATPELRGLLFRMEMSGYIRPVPGGYYRIVR